MNAHATLGPLWLAMAITALPTAVIEAGHVGRRLTIARGRAIAGVAAGRTLAVAAGVPAVWWLAAALAERLPAGAGWDALAIAKAVPWLPVAPPPPVWLLPVAMLVLLVPCALCAFAVEWAVGAWWWSRVRPGAIAGAVAGAVLRSHALLALLALGWLARNWWTTM
jgi:hypothetical protein